MKTLVGAIAGGLLACSSNVGVPTFPSSRPAPLPRVGAMTTNQTVRLEYKALPWWTVAGTGQHFILGFDAVSSAKPSGRRVGPVRSDDVALSASDLHAVRCAWMIVPMGDPRPCGSTRRVDAMKTARVPIDRARADLREQARRAGVEVVAEIRCFARQERGAQDAKLWCEGVAFADAAVADAPAVDPAAPIDREPRTIGTRLVLHADASLGLLGDKPVVGTTVGLRYRPLELGLTILDLQRESLAPMQGGLVGVGLSGLGRRRLGESRADLIAGVSAVAVAQNGATNPDIDGLFQGFAGIAYQTPWIISGAAQPFVQLRAGMGHGTHLDDTLTPMLELHIGLTTPERR